MLLGNGANATQIAVAKHEPRARRADRDPRRGLGHVEVGVEQHLEGLAEVRCLRGRLRAGGSRCVDLGEQLLAGAERVTDGRGVLDDGRVAGVVLVGYDVLFADPSQGGLDQNIYGAGG